MICSEIKGIENLRWRNIDFTKLGLDWQKKAMERVAKIYAVKNYRKTFKREKYPFQIKNSLGICLLGEAENGALILQINCCLFYGENALKVLLTLFYSRYEWAQLIKQSFNVKRESREFLETYRVGLLFKDFIFKRMQTYKGGENE